MVEGNTDLAMIVSLLWSKGHRGQPKKLLILALTMYWLWLRQLFEPSP